MEPERLWRVTNPAINAFFAAVWPQSSAVLGNQPGVRPDGSIRGGGAGELDPIANLSRYHYLKELFLDSATTMTVLSAVPTAPDSNNPLPIADNPVTAGQVARSGGGWTYTTADELGAAVRDADRDRGARGRAWVASEYAPARFDERLDRLLAWAEAS